MTAAGTCGAEEAASQDPETEFWQRESLTDGFFGLNERLNNQGIDLSLSATQVYQQNLRGGLSTHRQSGRYTGSYDLEISADWDKLAGLENIRSYLRGEGSWPRAEGINEASGGSFLGVNDDAGGARSMDITEFWFEKSWLEESLILRLGKIDLTCGFQCSNCPANFDGSVYAGDETTQFLNSALVNNPTIPFPDNGLGAVLYASPVEWWYAAFGAADAQADVRETGLRTAFHAEDYFLYLLETGLTPSLSGPSGPLQGAYRIGCWFDPQDKQRFASESIKRDDMGFYLSVCQCVFRENGDPEDTQGLGLFSRYGWADSDVNELTNFWSAGTQYQGLLPHRDEDVLAVGVAQGIFNNRGEIPEDAETALEVYYHLKVTGWMHLSPSVQYIANPAGSENDLQDAVVLGMRMQAAF